MDNNSVVVSRLWQLPLVYLPCLDDKSEMRFSLGEAVNVSNWQLQIALAGRALLQRQDSLAAPVTMQPNVTCTLVAQLPNAAAVTSLARQ